MKVGLIKKGKDGLLGNINSNAYEAKMKELGCVSITRGKLNRIMNITTIVIPNVYHLNDNHYDDNTQNEFPVSTILNTLISLKERHINVVSLEDKNTLKKYQDVVDGLIDLISNYNTIPNQV